MLFWTLRLRRYLHSCPTSFFDRPTDGLLCYALFRAALHGFVSNFDPSTDFLWNLVYYGWYIANFLICNAQPLGNGSIREHK